MDSGEQGFRGNDRFSVVRRIGAGGMGIVYEAIDRDLRNRRVALKTLRRLDPVSLYRFKQEFRALAELTHPNLVPLYELIGEGEQWFFTMEFVEDAIDLLAYVRPGGVRASDADTYAATAAGSTDGVPVLVGAEPGLERPRESTPAAARGGVDYSRLRAGFSQLALAVAALHAAGKLHRDLKPSNVLVRPDGHVVTLDFGLVTDLDIDRRGSGRPKTRPRENSDSSGSGHSTDAGLVGTIPYMSPEQVSGGPLTSASDWYAFGVTLFQALTGALPFSGPALSVMADKCTRDAPAPSDLIAGIPPDLEALCVALLRRDPDERPDAAEVLVGLGGAADLTVRTADSTPFVGRASHLSELHRAFETVRNGEAVVCHVHGRSGAGKSTLISRYLDDLSLQYEAVVLTGRCYEQESVPYKAIDSLVDALTHHLVRMPAEEVMSVVPSHAADLARVFPVLQRVDALAVAAREQPSAADLRQVRRFAFEALRELLGGLARRQPLVLFIDDLQWGDVDSSAVLSNLLQPPGAPPLLLLIAYRSEYLETSACLKALAASLEATSVAAVRVAVEALTPEDARELALSLLGSGQPEAERDADWIAKESGGSALFVYELVDYLKSGAATTSAPDLDQVLRVRVGRLPELTRRLLEVIAVAGRPVRIEHAQAAAHLPPLDPQVVASLRAGRLVRTMGTGPQGEVEMFHDRIRESIVASLPVEAIRHHHAGLATSLELSGEADVETLAVHFEGAGDRARASRYCEQAAIQAVQVLAFDRADALLVRAAALATSDADRARIHERMIHFYTDLARFGDAYAVARGAVEPFGVQLPAGFVPPLFLIDLLRAWRGLRGRRPAELVDLPTATDDRLLTAVRLMNAVAKAAYQIRPELCVAVSTKIVNLCLRHGNTPDCAVGYMVFGCIFQGGVLGRRRPGYEFGRLALDLVNRYGNRQQRAEVHFVVGYFGTSWLRPAKEAEALWRTAFDAGLETGDLFHTGCAAAATTMSSFMRGVPLAEVEAQAVRFLDVLERNRLREPAGVVSALRQVVRNLRGETRGRASLSDDHFDEEAFARDAASFGSRHFEHMYHVARLQVLYLWGEHEAARQAAARSTACLKGSPGMLHSAEHHFYDALLHAADGRSPARVRKAHQRFVKLAAENAENFRARAQILEGEVARLKGKLPTAARLLTEAADTAASFDQHHLVALASQLAAASHRKAANMGEADRLGRRAVEAWERWGATAYARHLSAQYANASA